MPIASKKFRGGKRKKRKKKITKKGGKRRGEGEKSARKERCRGKKKLVCSLV